MSKDTIRQFSVILALAATIIVNALANSLPINNQTTGEISDRFPVYFVPAGYVFAIWALIYLGLIIYAVYQALPAQKANPRLRSTGWLFVLSSVANIIWLFLWHYNQFTLSVIAMLFVLVPLIMIYLRLGIGRRDVPRSEKLSVQLPFSIYLGWITVATIANVTVALYDLGWNGTPLAPQVWAAVMLAAAALITAAVLYTRRDIAYALVIVWAAVGIAVKHSGTTPVPEAAWITAALVTLLVAAVAFRLLPRPTNSVRA
jgi:hypothetical protein